MALLGMQFEDGVVQYNLSNNVKIRKKDNIINLYRPYGSETISFSGAGWQTLATIPDDCSPVAKVAGIVVDNNTNDQTKLGIEFKIDFINGNYVIQMYIFTTAVAYNPMFNITYIN